MGKKKINSKLYSTVKYVHENHEFVYVTSKEGYLFSNLPLENFCYWAKEDG